MEPRPHSAAQGWEVCRQCAGPSCISLHNTGIFVFCLFFMVIHMHNNFSILSIISDLAYENFDKVKDMPAFALSFTPCALPCMVCQVLLLSCIECCTFTTVITTQHFHFVFQAYRLPHSLGV